MGGSSTAGLFIPLIEGIKDFFVGITPGAGGILFEMSFEGQGGRTAVPDVIANQAEGHEAAEVIGNGYAGGIVIPQAKSFIRQRFPGEEGAGIVLAGGCDIAMTDKIGRGDVVVGLEPGQQMQEAIDLCVGEGLEAVVVELDADRDRVDIRYISPFAGAGLPGPQVVVEHMVDSPIPADNIMCADLGFGDGKGVQGLGAAVLGCMVDDNEIRFTQIEIDGADPIRRGGYRINVGGAGRLTEEPHGIPKLTLVDLVGGLVRVGRACGQQEEKEE